MPLLGQAAVAMWWTIRPEQRAEFGDWHSHEHFPERMSIPGFRRGSRWSGDNDAFFVLYELDRYETLTSGGYLSRLNAPTPWSQKMMPHHLDMVRSQCRIAASFGGGIANSLATIRLAPRAESEPGLRQMLTGMLRDLPARPGLTGAHLLLTDTPRTGGPTTEQRIRGADRTADWVVLISGYEPERVAETMSASFSAASLRDAGAVDIIAGRYTLALTMTPQDLTSAR
jgi:hypothetical protein